MEAKGLKFNYDEFIHQANHSYLKHQEDLRYGQFLMNFLYEKHPEIYSQVPENLDPYYDNNRCGEFLKFIANLSCAG